MMRNICLVIPSTIGDKPLDEYIQSFLPENWELNYSVTALLHTDFNKDDLESLQIKDIKKISLKSVPLEFPISPNGTSIDNSYRVYLYLQKNFFDMVYFNCIGGMGFHSIQAKNTTTQFDETNFALYFDSASQWHKNELDQWNTVPVEETTLWYQERYCAEFADLIVSPTQYMIHWAEENGWKLSENQLVRFPKTSLSDYTIPINTNYSHIIFFGYLWMYSWVDIFCCFLEDQVLNHNITEVTFIGKDDWMHGYTTSKYLYQRLEKLGIKIHIFTDFSISDSIDYLKQEQGCVFCPPSYTSHNWQAYYCLENNIPIIAANVGDINENLPLNRLFIKDKKSLERCYFDSMAQKEFHFFRPSNIKTLTLDSILSITIPEKNQQVLRKIKEDNPLVSICIAHYNHHEFLPITLSSIENIHYENYEVLVVDDGSSLEISKEVFTNLEEKYSKDHWRFFRKENEYLGKTRNFLVDKALGEYIIFVDADNAVKANMVDDFLFGIYKSEKDCLTCHIDCFEGIGRPSSSTSTKEMMLPLGPALELGYIYNVFGDANFIIKRNTYLSAGGFPEERLSLDDWAFLTKLNLMGFKQDVIPLPLFHYRVLENSMVHTGDNYKSIKRILSIYGKYSPGFVRFTLESMLEPYYVQSLNNSSESHIFISFKRKMNRWFPSGSHRRKIILKFVSIFNIV